MRTKTTFLVMAIFTSISCNALNYFWVGGPGNWSDFSNHWATTSGGLIFHNQLPELSDNVFFDSNSFTASGQTVTVDLPVARCADMAWTVLPTFAPILVGNSSDTLRILGSLTLATGMTFNFNGQLSMETITAATITTAGTVINASLAFNGIGNIGGSWTLQDALTVTNAIYLNNGTFNTNNQTVNTFAFYSSTASVRSLIMGASTFNLSNFWYINPAEMTLNATNSTINYTGTSGSYLFFLGGGLTYNDVFFTGGGWGYIYNNNILHDVSFVSDGFISGNNMFHDVSFAANATINGLNSFNNVTIANNGTINNSNSFNNLTFSPFYSYTLEAGQTQTVGNICAQGTGALPIRIQSSVAGVPTIISKASGTMCWDYVHVSDITATGGATFNAGLAPTNSQDLGGNTGLLFTGGCIFVPCTSCTFPEITAQPSNSNVCTDGNTVFEIFATGTGLTYQWQVNDGSGFTNLFNTPPYSGVTTNTLNITSVALPANGYQYHCIVSGTCDSIIISNEGTLTVNSLPTVTANSATICSGQTAILTANGATNYVWSIGGMMGDTTNPISVAPLTTTAYIVTGTTNGCSNSAIATVTVNPLPIISAGQDATVLSNTPVQLGTTSFPALSYSWSPIAGLSNANVSNPTLVLQNNSSTPQTYTYILTATNGQCSKSDTVLITILGTQPLPNPIVSQISDSAFIQNAIPCGVSPEYFKSLGKTQGGPKLIAADTFPANAIEHCGHFDVYYEDLANTNAQVGYADLVWGADRRAVLCSVLTYVQTVFDFNGVPAGAPIRLHVDTSFATGVNPAPNTARFLAQAGPTHTTTNNTIVNGFVHDYTVSGNDPATGNQYHAELLTNFDQAFDNFGNPIPIPWNNTIAPATVNCLYDLYSVLLHEITHTLGWLSLVQINHNTSPATLEPANTPLNIFSGIDAILHRSPAPAPPVSLQPLLTGLPNNPIINPAVNALPNNNFWISGNPAPDNHPVYSGLLNNFWPGTEMENSYLSHLDGQMWLYSRRSRVSPGDVQDYVIQPYIVRGVLRRTYTDIEINTLTNIGYTINPNFNGVNLPNLPPYSPKMAGYNNILTTNFPETVAPDFSLINNIGSFRDISLATNNNDPNSNIDPENEPITVFPGSLVNIRGCGNGGNNHNQLTVSPNGQVITFTPRHNFYGRAQFGLKLFDGHQPGSYVIYTIDVTRGTNVSCNAGDNIILNGDLEEGTEVKRLGPDEVIDASQSEDSWLKEGKVKAGIQFADCEPFCYISHQVFPYGSGEIIRDSWINCNGTTYRSRAGSTQTSFPMTGGKPNSRNGIGNRYKILATDFNYFNLCSDMQHCNRYILEFDYYTPPTFPNSLNIPLTVGFTNAATFPTPAILEYNFIHNMTVTNGTWQHVVIPFTYCDTDIANILNLRSGPYFYIDNLSLIEDTSLVPPLIIAITPASQTICQGSNIILNSTVSNSLCTTTYNWAPGGQTTASITVAPVQTTTFTLTANDGCRTTSANSTITVIPAPEMTNIAAATICSGGVVNIPLTSDITSTYTWIASDNANTTGESLSTQTGNSLSNVIFNTSNTIQTVTYTVTPTSTAGDCLGVQQTVTITVSPNPAATATPSSQTACSGDITSIALTSDVAGTEFAWTVTQTGVSGATSGSGTSISQTLNTTGNTQGTAIYTITPTVTATGCSGAPTTVTIYINPVPVATANPVSQTICSGNTTSIALSSNITNTTFSWTVNQTGATGASAGSGTSIAQTLNATGTATYTITPTANGCNGTPVTVTITVNPVPVVTATPPLLSMCSGATGTINLSSNITGTTFSWSVTQGANVAGGSGGNGSTISPHLFYVGAGNTVGTATYTITPSNLACTGTPLSYTITVNPLPAVSTSVLSQTICSGTITSIGLMSTVPGTGFSWTIGSQSSGIGGASAGSGNTIAQTLTNSSTSNGTVGYLITGVSPAGCTASNTIGVNVTVKPAPIMQGALAYTVCSGAAANIALTSNIPSTYSWVASNNPNTVGESTTPQSGNIITDVINNNTTVIQTVTYTVTPTSSPGGCPGAPQNITVTINPPSPCCVAINYTVPAGGNTTSAIFGAVTTITGQNIAVNGNLTVNSNVTFKNCNFIMVAGVKITVTSSKTLTLTNQTHLYSCTNMWDGIYVNAGGQLYINGDAFIEDALNAVEIPNNGGYYNINGAIFNRNLKAVDLKGYTINYAGSIINTIVTSRSITSYPNPLTNVSVATLKGNSSQSLTSWTFANLRAPNSDYKGVFGVNATNVKYILVGIDGGNLFTNIFDNVMCGINLIRTSSDIYNNRFQNLLNTTDVACLVGTTCYNIKGIGINTNGTPATGTAIGNYSVNVGCTSCNGAGNKFNDTYQAISITNYKKVYIQKNTISNSTTASTGTTGYGNLGIMVKPAPGDSIIIRNNSVNNCATGIFVNRVSGNTINHPKGLIVDNDSITASGSGYCTNAIYIADYTTSVFAQVSQINTNTIINARNGIVLSNLKTTKILNNLINVLDASTGARNGIKAVGCYGVSILNNHTKSTSTTSASANLLSYGIYLSQSRNMVVKCNLVENAGRSLVFEGNCMSPTNMGYGILQNTMRKAQYGLVLKSYGVIGTQGNASNKISDNIWEGGTANFSVAQTLADNSKVSQSVLYISNVTTGLNTTRPLSNQFIGFPPVAYSWGSSPSSTLRLSTGSTINCVANYGNWRSLSIGDAEYAVELKAMEEDSTQFPVYNEETHWQHKKHVFDEIENNPQLTDDDDLNNFHNAHLNHTIGKLAKINDKLLQGNFNAANAINNSISPSNIVEQNQQMANALILKSALQSNYEYTSSDSSMLMDIAIQCPLAGGNAVYQARNLLMSIASNVIEFEDNCIDGSPKMEIIDGPASNRNNVLVYKIYPNPNDGNMIFEYSLPQPSSGILVLYDITGRIINKYNLAEGQSNQLKISEAALENGVYFYSVLVDGKIKVDKNKVVIIK